VLAADAAIQAGLTVPALSKATRDRLAELLPAGAATGNPVDVTATAAPARLRRAIDLLAASPEIDSVLAAVVPTAVGDLTSAVVGARVGDKPLALVALHQTEAVSVRPGPNDGVPSYSAPEAAARALGRAWAYGQWRTRPAGVVPDFDDIDKAQAATITAEFLTAHPDGGWLPPDQTMRLLTCYRLPLVDWRFAVSEDATADAAAELGGRVVLKADVPNVIHKSQAGAVELDLRGDDDVRRAHRRLVERFGERMQGVLVQPMATEPGRGGVELLLGAVQEPVFGPLVVFGAGGTATDALDDRAVRLAPLTDADAIDLIRSLHITPLLLGNGARPPVHVTALQNTILRLSQLADDLPEVVELDLNPVIARPDGIIAVDARIRLRPALPQDPHLRRLR
jgi:acyl-CoA synthetase (NDP forming)